MDFRKLSQGNYTLSLFAGQSGFAQPGVYRVVEAEEIGQLAGH